MALIQICVLCCEMTQVCSMSLFSASQCCAAQAGRRVVLSCCWEGEVPGLLIACRVAMGL